MVHADAAFLPSYVVTKSDFYDHLETSLASLIDEGTDWVSSLSNASSVIYHSMNSFGEWKTAKKINWAGFYLLSPLMPSIATNSNKKKRKSPTLLLGPFNGLPACQEIASVPGKGVCADASSLLPPRTVVVPNTEQYEGHIACDSASQSEIVVPLILPRSRLSLFHRQNLEMQSPTHPNNNKSTTTTTTTNDSTIPTAQAAANKESADQVQTQDRSWAGRGDQQEIIIGVLDIDCVALDGFDDTDAQRLQRLAQLIVDRSAW